MRIGVAHLWIRRPDIYALLKLVLFACALAALWYLAFNILLAAASGGFAKLGAQPAHGNLVLAGAIYLVGHGLRSLRLALLIGGWRVGLRTIVSFHFMTAAASLAVPLKLGELYRVAELSNVVGAFPRALAIVWWERAFDACAILLILLLASTRASGAMSGEFASVAVLISAFIILTALIFFVVPDNLRRLSVLIIRRYSSPRTVPILKFLDFTRRSILEAPRMVHAKMASLVALTALIWFCEVACFATALPNVTLGGALDSLLYFLSVITRGATLPGMLGGGEDVDPRVMAYLTVTQIPLLFLGMVAAFHYAAWRLRGRP